MLGLEFDGFARAAEFAARRIELERAEIQGAAAIRLNNN
jgi:hypothetical protein